VDNNQNSRGDDIVAQQPDAVAPTTNTQLEDSISALPQIAPEPITQNLTEQLHTIDSPDPATISTTPSVVLGSLPTKSPQTDSYSTPMMGSDVTQSPAAGVPQDGRKTLGFLHKHERQTSIIASVVTICLVVLNVAWGLHVLSVRHSTYETWYNNLPQTKAAKNQKLIGSGVENRPNGKLDMSRTINSGVAEGNQSVHAGLDQQINLLDGVSFMVTGVQKNWLPANGVQTYPFQGNYYIKLDMIVGNRSNQNTYFNAIPQEALVNGQSVSIIHFVNIYGQGVFPNNEQDITTLANNLGSITPGEVLKGILILQVPTNSLPNLVFSQDWLSYKGESITLQAEVTL
jgi:hypothetical protein